MGAAEVKEVKFEELRDGLNNKSLVYLDVRNRDELRTDGKVVGSVVVPRKYKTIKNTKQKTTVFPRYIYMPFY